MAGVKSVSTIIDLAKKSQYLALTDIQKGGLYGAGMVFQTEPGSKMVNPITN